MSSPDIYRLLTDAWHISDLVCLKLHKYFMFCAMCDVFIILSCLGVTET